MSTAIAPYRVTKTSPTNRQNRFLRWSRNRNGHPVPMVDMRCRVWAIKTAAAFNPDGIPDREPSLTAADFHYRCRLRALAAERASDQEWSSGLCDGDEATGDDFSLFRNN